MDEHPQVPNAVSSWHNRMNFLSQERCFGGLFKRIRKLRQRHILQCQQCHCDGFIFNLEYTNRHYINSQFLTYFWVEGLIID